MSSNLPPLVVESFQISLASGPLQAAEASINATKYSVCSLLPTDNEARKVIVQGLEECWLLCALIFSAGQAHGNSASALSEAAEIAADINQRNALDLVTSLRQKIIDILGIGVGESIADKLITTGEIINTLYGAGKIDGSQLRTGIVQPMQRGDKTC